MNDILKTLRIHHWVLVVLSAIACITTIVSTSNIKYWYAYEELIMLEGLNSVPLYALVSLTNSYSLGFDINNQVIVKVEPQESISLSKGYRRPDFEPISRLLKASFPEENISFSTASLSQIRRAFNLVFWLPLPAPDTRDFNSLKSCVKNADSIKDVFIVVEYPKARIDLVVPGEDYYQQTRHADVRVSGEKCVRLRLTPRTFKDVLQHISPNSDVFAALLDAGFEPAGPSSVVSFNELPIWWKIEDRTVVDAKRELERQLESSVSSQAILGVTTFRSAIAVIALPLAILLTQSLLWLHAVNGNGQITEEESRRFAWVGMYSGVIIEIVLIASLALFPALGIGLLCWVGGVDSWRLIAAIVFGSVFLGLRAWCSIVLLRREVLSAPV